MSIQKFVLGTVQFGIPYGISNLNGQVSSSYVEQILNILREKNIHILDTAKAYGTSENVIGEYIKKYNGSDFSIITKIRNTDSIISDIKDSITKLNVKTLYAVMYHSFDLFKSNPSSYNDLIVAKNNGLVEKIGFSLYMPEDVDFLLETGCEFDIVQVPYNIFDQKFGGKFEKLKAKGVEIHCRSIYLQGLLFMNPDELPKKLEPIKDSLNLLHHLSEKNNLTISELCLGFVLQNPFVDKIVLGVTNPIELLDNLKYFENNSYEVTIGDEILLSVEKIDKNLLNPSNWN